MFLPPFLPPSLPSSLLDPSLSTSFGFYTYHHHYHHHHYLLVSTLIIIIFIIIPLRLLGAGKASDGAMDAGNLLKPMLARGELKCIGATTLTEYRQYIEKVCSFF